MRTFLTRFAATLPLTRNMTSRNNQPIPNPDAVRPAVPPRPPQGYMRAPTLGTAGGAPASHRVTYHELEDLSGGVAAGDAGDFSTQFLQTTPDGNVFIPPGLPFGSSQSE